MPKQEKPLEPAEGPLAAFACELRALRAAAGLTYRELAAKAHYSHVSLVKAAGGDALPTWPVTKAFVTACGATSEDVMSWKKRWDTTSAMASAAATNDGGAGPLLREPAKRDPAPPRIRGVIAAGPQHRPEHAARDLYVPEASEIHSAADFARSLQRLKISAGDPSFREMARRGDVSASTLADQCNPARRYFDWATVAMFLDACGVLADKQRRWEEIFWQVKKTLVTHRAPVPQIDLTGVQTPGAFAQALQTLMEAAEMSYAAIVDQARIHPGSWPGARSTLYSKINQAVQKDALLDRQLVESFVRCCYCESLDSPQCSSHCHAEDVQRWLTVYDGLLAPMPLEKDLPSVSEPELVLPRNPQRTDAGDSLEAITTLEDLGTYLQELRDSRRVTQESLSTKTGAITGWRIARSRISEIENAKSDPVTEQELRAYMRGLKCTPGDIDRVVKVVTQCTTTRVSGTSAITDPHNDWVSSLREIPDPHSPAGQLAQRLRELAATAGATSLRALAPRVYCSPSTLSDALSGKPKLVPTMTIIEAICKVCNTDEPTLARLVGMRVEAIRPRPPEYVSPDQRLQGDSDVQEHDLVGVVGKHRELPGPRAPSPAYLRWALSGRGAVVSTYQVLRPASRRRISYRVHLDDRIGAQPDMAGVAELLVRRQNRVGKLRDVPDASLVLVRVSNDGGLDIDKSDYLEPVTFTFGDRKVVGVEVKDVTDAQRAMLLGHTHRDRQDDNAQALTFSDSENWLRLPPMQLNRGDRFRMLVLLSGPGTGVQASGLLKGAISGGGLVRDTSGIGPSRTTIRTFAFGLVAMVSLAVLILVLFFFPAPSNSNNSVHCVAGSITVFGSTAFAPAATDVADHYQKSCSSSTVAINPSGRPTGSHAGVLDLATKGKSDSGVRTSQLTMSDGLATAYPDLVAHPIAVIIFSVVINKATGIHSLTTDQLQKIYSGQVHNWAELGGQNLPIDIISRGTDSGTRSTFDQKVLDSGGGRGSEPPVSSYNCIDRDPKLPPSPVIRCETSSTEALLGLVNAVPGGIGYAEMSMTAESQPTKYQQVDQVQLNGRAADPESVKNNAYPFWTIEYFYSYGSPGGNLPLSAFLSYLSSDTAKSIMQGYGHIPCTDDHGNQLQLCR